MLQEVNLDDWKQSARARYRQNAQTDASREYMDDTLNPMFGLMYKVYENNTTCQIEFLPGSHVNVILPALFHLQTYLRKVIRVSFNDTLITFDESQELER